MRAADSSSLAISVSMASVRLASVSGSRVSAESSSSRSSPLVTSRRRLRRAAVCRSTARVTLCRAIPISRLHNCPLWVTRNKPLREWRKNVRNADCRMSSASRSTQPWADAPTGEGGEACGKAVFDGCGCGLIAAPPAFDKADRGFTILHDRLTNPHALPWPSRRRPSCSASTADSTECQTRGRRIPPSCSKAMAGQSATLVSIAIVIQARKCDNVRRHGLRLGSEAKGL